MAAFESTVSQLSAVGVSLAVAYFLNRNDLKFWRVIAGLLLGVTLGSLTGLFAWALFQEKGGIDSLQLATNFAQVFLFSIIASLAGIYFGRKNSMRQNFMQGEEK